LNYRWNLYLKFILIPLMFLAGIGWHGQTNAAQLTLTWVDNATNEEGFKIERLIGSTYREIATVRTNVESYTDSGLLEGITYCYRVRAFNSAANSAYSDTACATTTNPNVDTDGDGLSDKDEINQYGTDPLLSDTDGDGISDGQEVNLGTDALLADKDGDGISRGDAVNTYGSTARFLSADSTTQGDWQGVYGGEGFILVNYNGGGQDIGSLPSYLDSYDYSGSTHVWSNNTSDERALAPPLGNRVAATVYSGSSFSLSLTASDTTLHTLALYFVDFDSFRRTQTITIYDAATDAILDERTLTEFNGGVYYTYEVQGSIRAEFTRTGDANAVLSGVFWGGSSP